MPLNIRTTIEIAAPPSEVREKFLDFPSMPLWSKQGPVKSVSPPNPTVSPGDKLACELNSGTKFTAVAVENTPTILSWRGGLPLGALVGLHYFKFEESSITPGHTTFVHGEDFSGPLVWLGSFYPGIQAKAEKQYAVTGEELKKWVEEGSKAGEAPKL
ncbi:unnamed protein product [Zymoseptoria tritici ST99CH_1E4]|uniref:Uncharacterized protein n=1 Tax=Zymoseptoria tritici ST99CH_1E4 TaxID=1276532 RepID=A0A2H1G5E3_ZYMTR|nr:unnamed protein product [Zymoseptoria tritici ST99CH_1E4]